MTNRGMCLLYKAYSFIVYTIPMAALFIANADVYKSDGSIFGFWGVVILAFVCLSFKTTFINLIKNRTLMTVSGLFFLFSIIMHYLSSEMILISAVSFFGAVLQSIFEVVADVYNEHSYMLVDGVKKRNRKKAISQKEAWAEAYGLIGVSE